ncbi:hypothetical protein CASFOL_043180 [Castilleja foliolosa]|uniref:KIB1-4 beta-propeller domain-containing protein n=1 Tax=Castilleja foliolosa TaxID=1961234 RepID=A0ABD3B6U3_9LAMI
MPSQTINQEMKKRHVVPLLLTSHGYENEKQSVYSLIENRYETISHPVLEGKHILGSAYGWLVLTNINPLTDPDDCCLWNPESNEKIQLPRLSQAWLYRRCFLSKPPTDPDCLVVFQNISVESSVCRISDDEFVKVTHQPLEAMISSVQGEIYGIVQHGAYYELVTIHLIGKTVEFKSLLINGKSHWVVPELCRSWVTSHNYLIQSPGGSGEFFFVIKMASRLSTYSDGNKEFRVFRLDVNGLVCVELENLDGHTIFIGSKGNEFCCLSTGMRVKPNSIYYTEIVGRVVFVYDLDDRSTTPLLPCPVAGRNQSVNYWVDLPYICLV